MTLDEAIAHAREEAEDKRADADWKFRHGRLNADDCISCAEEHEQLAEWLEELKELRSMVKCNAFTDGYNKGIDDFLEIADKMEREDVLYYAALDEAAEQLKEGDNHGH